MKQQIRRFPVNYNLSNWYGGGSIEEIKRDIEKLESLGATHIEIDADSDGYGGAYVSITAKSCRLETEEEVEIRVKKENEQAEKRKAYELAQLALLKEKYEKSTTK